MKRLNRILTLIFLPLIVIIWILGWLLYWVGLERKHKVKKHEQNKN